MAQDSDVQKIKDRLSIVDVVGQYVQLKRAGRNYTAKCPFHKEKTPSFMVSPERGSYICFGCGEKGDIFSFVQKIDGIDFPTTLRQLADKAGVVLTPRSGKGEVALPEQKKKDERLHLACEEATVFFEDALLKRKDVEDYIRARGVHDETVLLWRLGYAPASWEELCRHLISKGFTANEIVEAGLAVKSEKKPGEIFDRFRGRIMFPINDMSGRVIAFSGRFFEKVPGAKDESEPAKYINSPETALFKKSKTLYALDKAKKAIRDIDCILLVEGQFDVVLSHQSGYPIAVALSGTALTPEHLSLLARYSKKLILALDADQAGVRSGLRSAEMALKAGFDVKVPTFPEGKDPADVARDNPELLKAAIRTSQTAIEFFLDVLRKGARDERMYKKIVEAQILPLIAAVPSAIEQEHFIRLVANKIHGSEAAVRLELAKRPTLSTEVVETSTPTYTPQELPAFEKKVAMLAFSFGKDTSVGRQLLELLGAERVHEIEAELLPHKEWLQFKFEQEVGEHSTPEAIAADMLGDLNRVVSKERFKMKFL